MGGAEPQKDKLLRYLPDEVSDNDSYSPSSTSNEEWSRGIPSEGSVVIDNLSRVDLFNDIRILIIIGKDSQTIEIQCNAGIKDVKQVGHLSGYGDVWFDANKVANSLYLRRMTSRFRVTFSSSARDKFVVYVPDDHTRRF